MKIAQIRVHHISAASGRVPFNNPPLNLMGPEFVLQFQELLADLESDDQLKVVVFESAVEGYFLNHSDFLAKLEDLTNVPQGPTGLEAWPDILVRLTRAPFVSIALIRGRATWPRRIATGWPRKVRMAARQPHLKRAFLAYSL